MLTKKLALILGLFLNGVTAATSTKDCDNYTSTDTITRTSRALSTYS